MRTLLAPHRSKEPVSPVCPARDTGLCKGVGVSLFIYLLSFNFSISLKDFPRQCDLCVNSKSSAEFCQGAGADVLVATSLNLSRNFTAASKALSEGLYSPTSVKKYF